MRFTVAANANEDVELYALTWQVSSSDSAPSGWNECNAGDAFVVANFKLYDSTDLNTQLDVDADWDRLQANGTSACTGATAAGFIRWADASASPLSVGAGTSRTFVLRIDTSNTANPAVTGTAPDTMSVSLITDTTLTSVDNDTAADGGRFFWRDGAVSSHITGYQVKNLDLSAGSVSF